MLGGLITGFADDWGSRLFSSLIGLCLLAAYCLLGAGWLIMKTEGTLQLAAVRWAQGSLWSTALGVAAISLATPWISERIFDKWFSFPNLVLLFPIPAMTVALFVVIARSLKRLPTRLNQGNQYGAAVPFSSTVGIFLLAFYGLAYSLFPWLVMDKLTLWQAASSTEALTVIFWGVVVVVPIIIGYTVFAYRVFWGKTTVLKY
jgi:cytochrome d ubiquinol oxidase subunit II